MLSIRRTDNIASLAISPALETDATSVGSEIQDLYGEGEATHDESSVIRKQNKDLLERIEPMYFAI